MGCVTQQVHQEAHSCKPSHTQLEATPQPTPTPTLVAVSRAVAVAVVVVVVVVTLLVPMLPATVTMHPTIPVSMPPATAMEIALPVVPRAQRLVMLGMPCQRVRLQC